MSTKIEPPDETLPAGDDEVWLTKAPESDLCAMNNSGLMTYYQFTVVESTCLIKHSSNQMLPSAHAAPSLALDNSLPQSYQLI